MFLKRCFHGQFRTFMEDVSAVSNITSLSSQVPFITMLALLCMWFGIAMPLVYLGYYFGFRKQPYDNPVRTNQIPRQVPEQRWYMNKFVGWVFIQSDPVFGFHALPCSREWFVVSIRILMAGILPFGAMFIELFFIFSVSLPALSFVINSETSACSHSSLTSQCVWPPAGHLGESVLLPVWFPLSGLHHLGGFLFSDQHRHGLFPALCRGKFSHTLCPVVAWWLFWWCCSCPAAVLEMSWNISYKPHLNTRSVSVLPQDYRWWWRTFVVSGGSAFYVLVYAVFYFVNKVRSPERQNSTSHTAACHQSVVEPDRVSRLLRCSVCTTNSK